MEKTRVLVVGAAGWLGHQIAAALLDGGKAEVRALVRSNGSNPEKTKRIDILRSRGMTVSLGDLNDPASLAKACEGIDVVISAVQGGPDVIVEGQSRLLAAAEAAGVKRMIPSDFSADISQLDIEDNYNLGLRKKFDGSFGNSSVAPTSVFCGGFLDVVLSQRFPTVDWEKGVCRVWGDGNQPLDYTAISDVALYTAAVAVDSNMTGKSLFVAGSSLTARELARTLESATGRTFQSQSLGTLEQLRSLIEEKKRAAKNPWEWISLQYAWVGASGKGKLPRVDNSKYPEIKPLTVEEFVRRNIKT
jgi:nucleoside-diphosphate-sugar epimerase